MKCAVRRFPLIVAQVEAEIEGVRLRAGLPVDEVLFEVAGSSVPQGQPMPPPPIATRIPAEPPAIGLQPSTLTFGEVYDRYINDSTRGWSVRTRNSYDTCRKLAVAIIGADLPIRDFARTHYRDFIETLRFLPKNANKRFPRLSPRQASEKAREEKWDNLISSANVNAYLTDLSSFLNWAVQEEYLDRNPARGLRPPDEVTKRNKRFPFSPAQLKKIFNAPLYRGCVDGERNYFLPGSERPRQISSADRNRFASLLDVRQRLYFPKSDVQIMPWSGTFLPFKAEGADRQLSLGGGLSDRSWAASGQSGLKHRRGLR